MCQSAIIVSPKVLAFAEKETPETLIVKEITSGRADSCYEKARKSFMEYDFNTAYEYLLEAFRYRNDIETDVFKRYFTVYAKRLYAFKEKYNFLRDSLVESSANKIQGKESIEVEIKQLNDKIGGLEKKKDGYKRTIENLKSLLDNAKKQHKEGTIRSTAEGVFWSLYDGMLTVKGGLDIPSKMPNYDEYFNWEDAVGGGVKVPPWYQYLDNITSIVIEYGVESIGNNAFCACENLTSVIIRSREITEIGAFAFYGCRNLTSVIIPDIIIPGGTISIEKGTFENCGLTSIVIPKSVVNIGDRAFSCENLTSIDVDRDNPNYSSENGILFNKDKTILIQYPKGKKDIEYVIPDGIEDIGNMDCRNLSSITIPENIKKLKAEFFWSNGNLEHIYMKGEIPPEVSGIRGWDGVWLSDNEYDPYISNPPDIYIQDVCILHIPVGSKNQYQSAYFWKDYKNMLEDDYIPMVEISSITREKTDRYGKTYYEVAVSNEYPKIYSFLCGISFVPSNLSKSHLESLVGNKLPGMVKRVECKPYEITDPETGKKKTINHENRFFPAKEKEYFNSNVTIEEKTKEKTDIEIAAEERKKALKAEEKKFLG